jgi:hypothetical protein
MTYKRSSQSHYGQGRNIENVQTTGRNSKGTKLKENQDLMDKVKFAKPLNVEPKYAVVEDAQKKLTHEKVEENSNEEATDEK